MSSGSSSTSLTPGVAAPSTPVTAEEREERLSQAVRTDVKLTSLYKLKRKTLGHGISGTVYQGVDKRTKENVAIKAMRYKDTAGACVLVWLPEPLVR